MLRISQKHIVALYFHCRFSLHKMISLSKSSLDILIKYILIQKSVMDSHN